MWGASIGWGAGGPLHHWHNAVPTLMAGGGLLFLFMVGMIGGWRERAKGEKPLSNLWPPAKASLNLCVAILISAVFLGMFIEVAYLQSNSFASKNTDYLGFLCKTNMEAVTQAIEKWAGNNGYALGDKYNWNINTVPMGNRIAQARLRSAWKPSPFDRWRSTWTSFMRVSPYLAFELVSSENPAETHLTVVGNMDCGKERIAKGTCHCIPEDLISVLDKLSRADAKATVKELAH